LDLAAQAARDDAKWRCDNRGTSTLYDKQQSRKAKNWLAASPKALPSAQAS